MHYFYTSYKDSKQLTQVLISGTFVCFHKCGVLQMDPTYVTFSVSTGGGKGDWGRLKMKVLTLV